MNVVPIFKQADNVIELSVIKGKLSEQTEPKKPNNRVAGVSSEVYPFTSEEEIESIINVLDKRIEASAHEPDETKVQTVYRNKMLFLVGINLGIRASDLCCLKYNFFMNEDGTFKEFYSLQPKKTKKTGKFVKLYFNETVKKAITNYIKEYPIESTDEYLFQSRSGDGHIKEDTIRKIVVDLAAEAGITKNVGSHSLRKTFGRFIYYKAEDKNNALIILQRIFNHSSPSVTSKYIGITDDEVSEVFNELNIGLDYI